jgi:hypothetical protein
MGDRHRNPVVAARVSYFAFDATLLMTFCGRAGLGLVLPVRPTENDQCPLGFFGVSR